MNRQLAAVVAVATLLVSSCSLFSHDDNQSPDRQRPGRHSPRPHPSPTTDVYAQEVTWENCETDVECTTIDVPLNWQDVTGETISLEVHRRLADDPDHRIGSLLINPGGPGGSGVDFLDQFVSTAGDALLEAYDIVAFDPRGVGLSTGLDCGDGSVLDEYFITDVDVETEADLADARERNGAFAQGCFDRSGAIIENMDTVSAARDMDVIRAVLGDDSLYYLGFSYGTQLGATYAELYPQHVGRMVLDGAVDFMLPDDQISLVQAKGFENALGNFITWCLDSGDCPLTGPAENARAQIAQLALDAKNEPFWSGNGVDVNGNRMVYGIVVTLYDEASWPYLKMALDETLGQGTAVYFSLFADLYMGRDGASGSYSDNSMPAFTAVSCLDVDAEDSTIDEVLDFRRSVTEAAPTFGWWFGSASSCEGWPFHAHEHITNLDDAATAAPMVVIGTTDDPATPFAWAQSLAQRLGATLLTYEGDGHTAYGRSNQCVIDAVDAYLVDGKLPAPGTTC